MVCTTQDASNRFELMLSGTGIAQRKSYERRKNITATQSSMI
jgi:hypothetical protein